MLFESMGVLIIFPTVEKVLFNLATKNIAVLIAIPSASTMGWLFLQTVDT